MALFLCPVAHIVFSEPLPGQAARRSGQESHCAPKCQGVANLRLVSFQT